eukprot:3076583-Amphidinium_carterae.1
MPFKTQLRKSLRVKGYESHTLAKLTVEDLLCKAFSMRWSSHPNMGESALPDWDSAQIRFWFWALPTGPWRLMNSYPAFISSSVLDALPPCFWMG